MPLTGATINLAIDVIMNVVYQPSRNLCSLISTGRTKYLDILESADVDWGDIWLMITLVSSG